MPSSAQASSSCRRRVVTVEDAPPEHGLDRQLEGLGVEVRVGARQQHAGLLEQLARRLVPDALFVSAITREGMDVLEARCLELIAEAHASTEMLVPHERYDVIARLHQVGHVQSEEQRDDGVHLRGRYPPTQAAYFAPFVVR